MASRLTDEKKAQIIAYYVDCGSARETAKHFGVNHVTVSRLVAKDTDMKRKATVKKQEAQADALEYFRSKGDTWKAVINAYSGVLLDPDKIAGTTTKEAMTILGILAQRLVDLDNAKRPPAQTAEKDPLTKAIEEAFGSDKQ